MITHLRFAATPAVLVVTAGPALGQDRNDGWRVSFGYGAALEGPLLGGSHRF